MGVRLFERSRARTIEEGERWRVVTDDGEVQARNIVVATNLPVKSPVGMANRTRPRSHPVLGFRIDDPSFIDGMFITAEEPTRSFRTGRDGDGPLLLVLGPRFDTGQGRGRRRPLYGARRLDPPALSRRRTVMALVQRGLRHRRPGSAGRGARSRRRARLSHRDRLQRLGHLERDRSRADDRGPHRRSREPVDAPLRPDTAGAGRLQPRRRQPVARRRTGRHRPRHGRRLHAWRR
jgi:hypothetical protein